MAHNTKRVFIDGEMLVLQKNKEETIKINDIYHLEDHELDYLDGYFRDEYSKNHVFLGDVQFKFNWRTINLL